MRAFVDNVFFAFFNEKNSLYKKEKAIVILKVLISMNRDIAFSRIAKNINKVIMYIDDNNFALCYLCYLKCHCGVILLMATKKK